MTDAPADQFSYRDVTDFGTNVALHGRTLEAWFDGINVGTIQGNASRGWVAKIHHGRAGEDSSVSPKLSGAKEWLETLVKANASVAPDDDHILFYRIHLSPKATSQDLKTLLVTMHNLAGGDGAEQLSLKTKHHWVPMRYGIELMALDDEAPLPHPNRVFLVADEACVHRITAVLLNAARVGKAVFLNRHPQFPKDLEMGTQNSLFRIRDLPETSAFRST